MGAQKQAPEPESTPPVEEYPVALRDDITMAQIHAAIVEKAGSINTLEYPEVFEVLMSLAGEMMADEADRAHMRSLVAEPGMKFWAIRLP